MFREPFPILYVADVERSLRFYCDGLGFRPAYRWPAEGRAEFAFVKLEQAGLGLASLNEAASVHGIPLSPPGPPRFELCLYTDDTDRASAHLLASGARQRVPPADMPWGERLAYFEDPDGHLIQITARLPDRPAPTP